jgi:ABC-2 type transport system permease protein
LLYHSILLVYFSLLIITEFSTILFDTKDNVEILPRPIDSKTFYASRIVHIVIYLLRMGIPLSLGGVLFASLKLGPSTGLLLFILVLLDVVMAVFISNIFYMGVIRFFSAEKFKTIIMYVQVLLAVIIYGGYQFVPKLFDNEMITEAHLGHQWWLNLILPYWPAKVSTLFLEGNFYDLWPQILLNFLFPVLGIVAIVKYFAPFYNRKLSEIDGISDKPVKNQRSEKKQGRVLIDFLRFSTTEKALYRLIRMVVSKDRKFKQGVYSLVGYAVVLLLLPFASKIGHAGEFLSEVANSKRYFIVLFVPTILSLVIYPTLQYSEEPESVWLFRFLPIKQAGEFFIASLMITLINYFLPMALIALLITFLIWPLSILNHVVLIFGVSLLFMALYVLILPKYLPLSRDRSMSNSSQNIGNVMLMFALIAAVGGLVYACSLLPAWTGYAIGTTAVIVFLMVIKRLRRIPWEKIQV